MNIFVELLQLLVNTLRKNRKLRLAVALLSLLSGLMGLMLYFATHVPHFENAAVVLMTVSFFVFLAALLAFTSVKVGTHGLEFELGQIRQEREEIKRRIQEEPRADVLDTIQLSLNQIAEYYTINKSQARNSFRFSVFAVVVGLATLIVGIWMFYLGESHNLRFATITSIAGTLIQFIGGAYFYLYRISIQQLNYFYEQLVNMQHTMLAIKLSEQIEDRSQQSKVKEQLIAELIARGATVRNEPYRSPRREKSSKGV